MGAGEILHTLTAGTSLSRQCLPAGDLRTLGRDQDRVQIQRGLRHGILSWPASAAGGNGLRWRGVRHRGLAVDAILVGAHPGMGGPLAVAVVEEHVLAIAFV